jgi:hypothetical protein
LRACTIWSISSLVIRKRATEVARGQRGDVMPLSDWENGVGALLGIITRPDARSELPSVSVRMWPGWAR